MTSGGVFCKTQINLFVCTWHKHLHSVESIKNRQKHLMFQTKQKVAELIPYLESFSHQNHELNREVEKLKQQLREMKYKHRDSTAVLQKKMLKRLLEAEEKHENDDQSSHKQRINKPKSKQTQVADKVKAVSELEKKIQNYEEVNRETDANDTLQKFLTKENQYTEKITQLEQTNKRLEDELKAERIKAEDDDRERRKSVVTLHNRMFKRFLDAEEESESMIIALKERVQLLERELYAARFKTEEIDKKRRESISALHSNMFKQLLDAEADHDQTTKNFILQIQQLRLQIKALEIENSQLKKAFLVALGCIYYYYEGEENKKNSKESQSQETQSEAYMYICIYVYVLFATTEIKKDAMIYYKQAYEMEKMKTQYLQNQLKNNHITLRDMDLGFDPTGNPNAVVSASASPLPPPPPSNDLVEAEIETETEIEIAQKYEVQLKEMSETIKQKEAEKLKYEQQIKELKQQVEETTSGGVRRASEIHHSMFSSLLEAERDYEHDRTEWTHKELQMKHEMASLTEELNKMKDAAANNDKTLRQSIAKLQDDTWKHLVEVDEGNKQLIHKIQLQNQQYQHELTQLKAQIIHLETSKLATIDQCNQQINLLRDAVRVMNQ
ncbi:hypothetical protein RFI_10755 [Reticulomyxa filosa]|uniref:Viral A-type inclusion protein n=1 Tax=Reticulomyxa filosa TaxID=46433 RepID=X6NKH3_RETFI|nr:hypothetical protein RFI_10755 [Reticulomyxa filosa]|eukprot:ETO26383.1 hypothetical protein RFI_10755 [Reticulomyxa filosa]